MYDSPRPIPGGFFSGQVFFPKDGVLARTISLEMERGSPQSRRRLETQILHFDGGAWHGYSYHWNDEQTDATLVPAAGADRTFTVVDPKAPGGKREQHWHFASRAECITCHNPWAGYALAFNAAAAQPGARLRRRGRRSAAALCHCGAVSLLHEENGKETVLQTSSQRLTNPHDAGAKLPERRGRICK